ncbi:hypothetical protein WN51_10301 [Melipona quadrifasciata]|uniref:Uncharacterized protein n=1 Tax=Melipona quadrifasciata TaxID=166423 RepID=A0A0N0BI52_9HYME|nr:hypothetical protein WN51_10301 [Melipona quadrifasciata]
MELNSLGTAQEDTHENETNYQTTPFLLEVYPTPAHESRDPNRPIANFRCISVAPEEARLSGLAPLKSLSVTKKGRKQSNEPESEEVDKMLGKLLRTVTNYGRGEGISQRRKQAEVAQTPLETPGTHSWDQRLVSGKLRRFASRNSRNRRPRIPQIRVSNTRLAQTASGCAPSVDVLPIFDVKQQSVRNPARMGANQLVGLVIISVWSKGVAAISPTDEFRQ